MKLSEIKGEQALDVLADLMEPIGELVLDKELVELIQSNKPKLLAVRKALKDHKKEVLTILAILEGENPETYKPSVIEIPVKLVELLNDEAVQMLFQSQELNPTSFGSATANTEAEH